MYVLYIIWIVRIGNICNFVVLIYVMTKLLYTFWVCPVASGGIDTQATTNIYYVFALLKNESNFVIYPFVPEWSEYVSKPIYKTGKSEGVLHGRKWNQSLDIHRAHKYSHIQVKESILRANIERTVHQLDDENAANSLWQKTIAEYTKGKHRNRWDLPPAAIHESRLLLSFSCGFRYCFR